MPDQSRGSEDQVPTPVASGSLELTLTPLYHRHSLSANALQKYTIPSKCKIGTHRLNSSRDTTTPPFLRK